MEFIKILSCLVKNTHDKLQFNPGVLLEFTEYDDLLGDCKNISSNHTEISFKYYIDSVVEENRKRGIIDMLPIENVIIYTKRFTITISFSLLTNHVLFFVNLKIKTRKTNEIIKIKTNNDLMNNLYYSIIEYTLKNRHKGKDFGNGILSDLKEYDKRKYLALKQLINSK